jgi:hypothetical protein
VAHLYGARRILVIASLGAAAGLSLLSADGWVLWGAIVATIVLRALTQPLTAPLIAESYPKPERVRALARQATWRDIGAGTGPLAAGFLFQMATPFAIYGGAALLLAATSLMVLSRTPAARED